MCLECGTRGKKCTIVQKMHLSVRKYIDKNMYTRDTNKYDCATSTVKEIMRCTIVSKTAQKV